MKAFHRFLRFHNPHLPSRGKHPAVEIAAEIDRRLHAEMIIIHDLRRNILPEAVDDAIHEEVFAEQPDLAFFAVEHGEFLREELRYIKVFWPFHRSFIRDLHLNDAVNAKLCNLLPMIMEADEIVCIVVPKHGKRGDRVDLSAAPAHPLLGRRVVEITEGDFLPLRDGGLDSVYIQINALVGGLGTAVDVEMPVQKGCAAGSNEG